MKKIKNHHYHHTFLFFFANKIFTKPGKYKNKILHCKYFKIVIKLLNPFLLQININKKINECFVSNFLKMRNKILCLNLDEITNGSLTLVKITITRSQCYVPSTEWGNFANIYIELNVECERIHESISLDKLEYMGGPPAGCSCRTNSYQPTHRTYIHIHKYTIYNKYI